MKQSNKALACYHSHRDMTSNGTLRKNDKDMITNAPVKFQTCPGHGHVTVRVTGTDELLYIKTSISTIKPKL